MKQSEEVVRQEAQNQAEEAFDNFMSWAKKITVVSVALLLVVVVGCNSGVQDSTYPAYNGEQYDPTNMDIRK